MSSFIINAQNAQIENLKRELMYANKKLSQAEQDVIWCDGTITALKNKIEELKRANS